MEFYTPILVNGTSVFNFFFFVREIYIVGLILLGENG